MIKEFRYLPLQILLCIILGIYLQQHIALWKFGFIKLYISLGISTIALYIFSKLKSKLLFILTTALTCILIGVSSIYTYYSKNYSNYYKKHDKKNSTIILELRKELKPNFYNYRFIANVKSIDNKETIGRTLINISKNNKQITELLIGNYIITQSEFKEINQPKNPYDFNYKNYLILKDIESQLFLKENNFKFIRNKKKSFTILLLRFKKKIQKLLQPHFSKDVYGIINSLLLGERKEVSKELLSDYVNAGAIHILAISGLHIGILVLLLNYLFYPINHIKYGRPIRLTLVLSILWLFAFITGLSASVVRATTMFSFIVIGKFINQKQPIENSLISSMLLLLLCKPVFLFDIGFQLSYLAVISIIKLQPLLYKICKPKYIVLDKIWQLTTVSITAQIGVLPLSLYYFHQFPSLFLISNLVIVPCLGLLLLFGILIIILALLKSLPEFLASFYELIINLMNEVVTWIAMQEAFILKGIRVSSLEMLFYYFIIIFSYHFIRNKSVKTFLFTLSFVICLQVSFISNKNKYDSKRELIIFHKNKVSLIGKRTSNTLEVYNTKTQRELKKEKCLVNYNLNENIDSMKSIDSKRLIELKNNVALIIDSLGVYPKKFPENSIVVLQYSPKLNLNRLIKALQPQQIIADGSNYKSYIERWKQTCKKQKTPFHSTKQNGAYILKY